jgi:hypothetical protein
MIMNHVVMHLAFLDVAEDTVTLAPKTTKQSTSESQMDFVLNLKDFECQYIF